MIRPDARATITPGRWIMMLLIAAATTSPAAAREPVELLRTPNDGLQPRAAVADDGTLHLIYYQGDPAAGDIHYVRSEDGGQTFSQPLRVNSQPGSAVAIGNIRGPRLALGKDERVHVVWVGSQEAKPRGPEDGAPLLYSRINDARDGFEPQRSLLQESRAIDGGGDIAADDTGNVYAVWHALPPGAAHEESNRRIWMARSSDGGQTFNAEQPIDPNGAGACGCCGLSTVASDRRLSVLYRAARDGIERHMTLLSADAEGREAQANILDQWELRRCPLSTATIRPAGNGLLLAWQTKQQVYWMRAGSTEEARPSQPTPATGEPRDRKHPVAIPADDGRVLLAWTEGVGWDSGGSLAWQLYDRTGEPIDGATGRRDNVPKWSLVTGFTRPDGTFVIVY